MSYSLVTEGLNKITDVLNWRCYIIYYNHNRCPNEFNCFPLLFEPPNLLDDIIIEQKEAFLKIVHKYENKVVPYTGYNPKNVVEKVSVTGELLSDQWISLVNDIDNCDEVVDLNEVTACAYIFVGNYKYNGVPNNLYLLTKKNPIVTYKKGRAHIFTSNKNTVIKRDEPLIQFSRCFDGIIYKDNLYAINHNFESIFNISHSYNKICSKHLDELEKVEIVEDFDEYKKYASKGFTPKKFIAYDSHAVKKLKSSKNRKIVSDIFHIPLNKKTGKFDLSDEKDAKNFTLAICGKAKREIFADTPCEVPMSVPIIIA